MNNNWRTGRCITRIIPLPYFIFDLKISSNGITWFPYDDIFDNAKMTFLNRTTLQVNTVSIDFEGHRVEVENDANIGNKKWRTFIFMNVSIPGNVTSSQAGESPHLSLGNKHVLSSNSFKLSLIPPIVRWPV